MQPHTPPPPMPALARYRWRVRWTFPDRTSTIITSHPNAESAHDRAARDRQQHPGLIVTVEER